jgi:hypothetical protein
MKGRGMKNGAQNIMDCGRWRLVRPGVLAACLGALAGCATTFLAVSLSMLKIDQTRHHAPTALRRARA